MATGKKSESRKQLVDACVGRLTFIAGNRKNAGKTILLNYLLGEVRRFGSPAFLSIGIDGESIDAVFGTSKPQVKTQPGDWVVTSIGEFEKSDGLFELEEIFESRTVLGALAMGRTRRAGSIVLVGPETNDQLVTIIETLYRETQARTVLVDGAANRITQVAVHLDAGFLYVITVDSRTLPAAVRQLENLCLLSSFPVANRAILDRGTIIEGAVTRSKLQPFLSDDNPLIIEDFTKVFLPLTQTRALLRDERLFCLAAPLLRFVVVNLVDLAPSEFESGMGRCGLVSKIIYNPYRVAGGTEQTGRSHFGQEV